MQTNLQSPKAKIGKNFKQGNFNIIEDDVEIGDNVTIGNYCHLKNGVKIASNSILMNNIELRNNTVIGNNCYIDSGVKSSGNVVIGDNVTLRYDVILARGLYVGDGTYICPRVMTNNLSADKDPIGGAKIGENCFIGTNAVLHYGINIGKDVVIGAMSFVNKDVENNTVLIGIPARPIK